MILDSLWWQRHRWTLVFTTLALGLGLALAAIAEPVATLQAPYGHRSTFYVELFFGAVAALVVLALLVSRARTGLPILLAALAFLPSRSGMAWSLPGPLTISYSEIVVLVGLIVLLAYTKVVRKERLQPLAVSKPLWIWLVFAPLGLMVALANGVPWANYVTELTGWYLWIAVAILTVNVVRTRLTLWAIMLVAVLSPIPNVVGQIKDAQAGSAAVLTTLGNGMVVQRTSGGSGAINQFAFYIMIMFFVALGLGMASRRWVPRLFFYGCAAYFIVGLGLTYTRGAWIATAVGLLVLGVAGGRKVLAGLLVAGVISYFLIPSFVWTRLNFSDQSTAERIGYLRNALPALQAHPLLGGGWGSNFYVLGHQVVPDNTPGSLPFWHDDYLIVATQIGLPGLAAFAWILIALAWTTVRTYRRAPPGPLRIYLLVFLAALAAMCFQAGTEMFFWNAETAPIIWLIVGLICATVNMIEGEARASVPAPVPAGGRATAVWAAR